MANVEGHNIMAHAIGGPSIYGGGGGPSIEGRQNGRGINNVM